MPNLPLPPEPSITRWGTWLKAVLFYSENFEAVKPVVFQFYNSEAIAIKSSKVAFEDPCITQNISLISTYFHKLPDAIEKLETENFHLFKSIEILEATIKVAKALPNSISGNIHTKLDVILRKNASVEDLKNFDAYINGTGHVLPKQVSPDMAPNFKFCPMTSVDVERSFSVYKLILGDKRHKFELEHLERYLYTAIKTMHNFKKTYFAVFVPFFIKIYKNKNVVLILHCAYFGHQQF